MAVKSEVVKSAILAGLNDEMIVALTKLSKSEVQTTRTKIENINALS